MGLARRETTEVPLDVLERAVLALDAAKNDLIATLHMRFSAAQASGALEFYLREAKRTARQQNDAWLDRSAA